MTQPPRQLVLICGGRGTRLRTELAATLPKSMTEIAGEPDVRRLIRQFLPLHAAEPGPIVIVALGDELTPQARSRAVGLARNHHRASQAGRRC